MDFSFITNLYRKRQKDGNQIRSVSVVSGFFFMINFVVGTGFSACLTPSTVQEWSLELIVLSFISWNTANWVVETMARAQVSLIISSMNATI